MRSRLNTRDLKSGLKKLAKNQRIHPAFKQGLEKLYDYTSDEKGVRHSLVDRSKSEVDEATALFMRSACAAFVGYIINMTEAAPKASE